MKALYFLFVCMFLSCTNESIKHSIKDTTTIETYETKAGVNDVEILKVRDCEYVFWHNTYGSDMEHYEGCNNINHCKL